VSELVPIESSSVQSDANGAPVSPRGIVHRGGAVNASVATLRERFGAAVLRHEVVWGETTVFVERAAIHDIIRWLHDEPTERYDYLVDITAVEYRDANAPSRWCGTCGHWVIGASCA
jgi:NADH-quinone oxidoreductase subunit C